MREVLGKNEGGKKAQILVQAAAVVRNMAGNEEAVESLMREDVLLLFMQILRLYPDHNELVLNIWRFLSKISVQDGPKHSLYELGNEFIDMAIKSLDTFQANSAVLIRIAFVLGNLTTLLDHSGIARRKSNQHVQSPQEAMMRVGASGLGILFSCLKSYWEKDKANFANSGNNLAGKKIGMGSNTIEDALTKLLRVLANVMTA